MRWIYRIAALGLLPYGIQSILQDLPGLWTGANDFMVLTGIGALIGFAILLPGVLNLLNDTYGEGAPGLRVTTLAVNLPMTLLFIRLEMISWEGGLFVLLPFLFAILSVFSLILVIEGRKAGEPGEVFQGGASGLEDQ